ncbi:MAG TPA: AMP-binding protein [Bryobacteraceae bacterium]|nr:AMP-binding protein [Bryobacteraceae bacterium]
MFAWSPDDETRRRAQLTRFLDFTRHSSFENLHRWSVENVPAFTDAVLRFLDLPFHRPYTSVVDLSRGPEWPVWCVGGGLNVAVACLRDPSDRLALIWEGEEGTVRRLTYGELQRQVHAFAAGLRSVGVRRGDAVAIHLPMMPETAVALIACAYIGAVAVPLFSGFGPTAVDSRIKDAEARAVITCDAFPRRGRLTQPARSEAAPVRIVVSRSGHSTDGIPFAELLNRGAIDGSERTAAEDPLVTLYTSGTTGRPKGILHTHCGFPVKAAQDMCFGTDVGAGTRICWITDIGWMMGPWLIYGAFVLGATVCLYDGAPDYPDASRLWSFVERHGVEVLGISPTLIRALSVHGGAPADRHDLTSLRIFASTGEPWNPDPWWFLFETVGGKRIPIVNYSGGTEISGGILMGNPLLPLKPCGFPAPCPGIDADIVDEQGQPVTGRVGELVIRKPWIGMARGFLRDPQRYLDTYWSRWPGVWTHGDFGLRDDDGHWFILGRSDDTLKIAGKRVGPAEVESVLVSHEAVAEAAAIGAPHHLKGECLVAFCIPVPGLQPSPELASELCNLVAAEMGRPLRPEAVHFIPSLPRTRNAKVMRRVIRAAYLGEDPGDLSALENPAAVDAIRSLKEDRT